MDLRTLKKEVRALPNIEKKAKEFSDSWLKPIRSNTNSHLPFIQKLSPDVKKELNQKLLLLNESLSDVRSSQVIHDKFHSYSKALIDLKLTELQNDEKKASRITNSLLHDDFLRMDETIKQVKAYDNTVKQLSTQYDQVNELLHKELSLEHAVFFMGLPHRKYLTNLMEVSKNQKKIVRHLGRHFIDLAKQSPVKRAQARKGR